jgi:hypothetical protein
VVTLCLPCRASAPEQEWGWQVVDRVAQLFDSHVIRLRPEAFEGETQRVATHEWFAGSNLLGYCNEYEHTFRNFQFNFV